MTTTITQTTARRTIPAGPTTYAAGAALAAIAAFLPWQTATLPFIGQVNIAGMEGDGRFTLAAAALIAFLAVWRYRKPAAADRAAGILAGLTGLGIAAVAVFDIARVYDVESDVAHISVGAGLWLTAIAGLAVIVGAAIDVIQTLDQQNPNS